MAIKNLGKVPRQLTKQEIERLAAEDANEISADGQYDLLKTYIELKRYSLYLDQLINELKEPALEQARTFDKFRFTYANAQVRVVRRVQYDYSGDQRWVQLHNNVENFRDKLKKHQEKLRQLTPGAPEIVDEETGEVLNATPPQKTEETSLAIRIE